MSDIFSLFKIVMPDVSGNGFDTLLVLRALLPYRTILANVPFALVFPVFVPVGRCVFQHFVLRTQHAVVKLFIPKGPTDQSFIQMISSEQKRVGRSLPIYSLLVLNSLRRFHKATVQDVAEDASIDENRARITLELLTESGMVEAGGTGRGRYFMLGHKYYHQKKDLISYTRQKDIESIRHDELILQLAKRQGYVRRADVVELLHVTPPQAYRALARLANENKLALNGNGAGAKYLLVEK